MKPSPRRSEPPRCLYPVPVSAANPDGRCARELTGQRRHKYCVEHAPLAYRLRVLSERSSTTAVRAWRRRYPDTDVLYRQVYRWGQGHDWVGDICRMVGGTRRTRPPGPPSQTISRARGVIS